MLTSTTITVGTLVAAEQEHRLTIDAGRREDGS